MAETLTILTINCMAFPAVFKPDRDVGGYLVKKFNDASVEPMQDGSSMRFVLESQVM